MMILTSVGHMKAGTTVDCSQSANQDTALSMSSQLRAKLLPKAPLSQAKRRQSSGDLEVDSLFPVLDTCIRYLPAWTSTGRSTALNWFMIAIFFYTLVVDSVVGVFATVRMIDNAKGKSKKNAMSTFIVVDVFIQLCVALLHWIRFQFFYNHFDPSLWQVPAKDNGSEPNANDSQRPLSPVRVTERKSEIEFERRQSSMAAVSSILLPADRRQMLRSRSRLVATHSAADCSADFAVSAESELCRARGRKRKHVIATVGHGSVLIFVFSVAFIVFNSILTFRFGYVQKWISNQRHKELRWFLRLNYTYVQIAKPFVLFIPTLLMLPVCRAHMLECRLAVARFKDTHLQSLISSDLSSTLLLCDAYVAVFEKCQHIWQLFKLWLAFNVCAIVLCFWWIASCTVALVQMSVLPKASSDDSDKLRFPLWFNLCFIATMFTFEAVFCAAVRFQLGPAVAMHGEYLCIQQCIDDAICKLLTKKSAKVATERQTEADKLKSDAQIMIVGFAVGGRNTEAVLSNEWTQADDICLGALQRLNVLVINKPLLFSLLSVDVNNRSKQKFLVSIAATKVLSYIFAPRNM